MLPRLKKIPGKKVVIGNNFSSHINVAVLDLYREHDIHFVCLPPHSTHVTQPLDVVLFAPLKRVWREILTQYKETHVGSRSNVLEKQHFPTLLQSLMEKIRHTSQETLKAGFKKCEIVPCDITSLLERLHPTHPSIIRGNDDSNNITTPQSPDIENSFIDYLKGKREKATQFKHRGKKKKMSVPPGQSIAQSEATKNSTNTNEASSSGLTAKTTKQNILHDISDDDSLSDETRVNNYHLSIRRNSSDDEVDEVQEMEEVIEFNQKLVSGTLRKTSCEKLKNSGLKDVTKAIGEHVIFSYENNLYPGVITSLDKDGAKINTTEQSLNYWKWPAKHDEIWYTWDQILGAINPPKQVSKREECNTFWWE